MSRYLSYQGILSTIYIQFCNGMQTVINFPILSFQFCAQFPSFFFLFFSFLFYQFALSSQIRNMSPIFFFSFRLSITLFYDSFKRFYVEKVGVLWATLRVEWCCFFVFVCLLFSFFSFGCDGRTDGRTVRSLCLHFFCCWTRTLFSFFFSLLSYISRSHIFSYCYTMFFTLVPRNDIFWTIKRVSKTEN